MARLPVAPPPHSARLSNRAWGCLILLLLPYVLAAAAALFFALVGLGATCFRYMMTSLGT